MRTLSLCLADLVGQSSCYTVVLTEVATDEAPCLQTQGTTLSSGKDKRGWDSV